MTIWSYPRDGFTELKIVVSWRKLRTRVIPRVCVFLGNFLEVFGVSLSFRRLWPLRYQLQWLMGVTGIRMRLCYIICNSFIKCFTLFWYETFAQTNYTVAVTVRCFGAFVTEYCCSDSVIVKLFCCNCCSDSFVGKLTNFNSSILLVFRYEGKKITFFSIYWNAYPVVGWQVTFSHGYTG